MPIGIRLDGCIPCFGRLLLFVMIVYHYTSVEVLEKMLKIYSADNPYLQLRPSHCLFLNDIYENINSLYIIPHFISDLEDELQVEKEYRVDRFFHNKETFNMLLADRTSFNPKYVSYLENFILSFSKVQDNLPMWTTYAQRGEGICLGFETDLLNQKLPKWNVMMKDCQYYDFKEFKNINYKEEEIYKDCKTFYEASINPKVLATRYKIAETDKGEELTQEEKYRIRTSSIIRHLNSFGSFFVKEKSWAYEKEYRILLPGDKKDIRYYRRGDHYVPYVYVKVPIMALKEIIVGPRSPRYTDAFIESLLIDKNISLDVIRIEKSFCPLK